jgi:hypothetical protein
MRTLGAARGLVAVLVVAVSVGCSSAAPAGPAPGPGSVAQAPAPAVPARAYRNAQYGYSLDPPPGWTLEPNRPAELKDVADLFIGPPHPVGDGYIEVNMVITVDPMDGADLNLVTEAMKVGLKSDAQTRLLADEPLTLADGRPARLLSLSQPSDLGAVRTLQLIVVDRGRAHNVVVGLPESVFARDEPALRASLVSFTAG